MKKYLNISLCALMCLGATTLTSCNEGGGTTDGGEITSITLQPSKTTIEANNEDVVKFTILDQDGRDVSNAPGLRVMNTVYGDFLDDDLTITAFMEEDLTFVARGNGHKSEEVTIKAVNRNKYEKYYRNIGMYIATGTWCQYCPNMTKALNEYTKLPDRMIRMAYHVNNSQGSPNDPFEITASGQLVNKLNIGGYPSGVIDLHTVITSYSDIAITGAFRKTLKEYPATCGVKISSTYDAATKTATIKPEVAFEKEGEYAVGWAIVSNNLESQQKMPDASISSSYIHHHVVRQVDNVFGNSIGKQAANSTWAPTQDFKTGALPDPAKDMNVVVFVTKKSGENYYINNLATCPVDGGSVDYKLN